MSAQPVLREQCKEALKKHGPMGLSELARAIGRDVTAVHACLKYSRARFGGEYFYMVERGARAKYAAGPGVDAVAKKPKGTIAAHIEDCLARPASPFAGLGCL